MKKDIEFYRDDLTGNFVRLYTINDTHYLEYKKGSYSDRTSCSPTHSKHRFNTKKAELEKIHERLKPLADQRPICPYCNSGMRVVEYRGYYDSFKFWKCVKCGEPELEAEDEDVGQYA